MSMFFEDFFLPEIRAAQARREHVCKFCGTSEEEVIKTGRVGCAECYREFANILTPHIRRIHGNATHVGRVPAKVAESPARRRAALEKAMQDAIAAQEFERAAEIRDELKSIEGGEKHE